ncbi:hypothetical protein GJ744_010662 [Endocarpon pusillum]|uniref:Uncharacterized protein n=1 Tax=Endocarpon pusillum TaxID=364733 RepID=A0A8H7ADY8_9EURO|nr:hypothetical protein GJ744_010662 [Endocarpon pusillum]
MIVEVKPSSKWNPHWWDMKTDGPTSAGEDIDITDQVFYASLAQTHYYMRHSGNNNMGPHYRALLTDEYLVPVYRAGPKGEVP